MGKWEEYKKYITSPPPELIAKIEVQGHFLNILGILAVSIILVLKGYWYIIFAFIFSTLVSWSQGMGAYARYKVFKSFLPEETYEYILQDKSFTRIRQRIITKRYGRVIKILMLLSFLIITVFIGGIEQVNHITWLYTLKIGIVTGIYYMVFMYLIIANILIKIKKEELIKNGIQTEVNTNFNT